MSVVSVSYFGVKLQNLTNYTTTPMFNTASLQPNLGQHPEMKMLPGILGPSRERMLSDPSGTTKGRKSHYGNITRYTREKFGFESLKEHTKHLFSKNQNYI